MNSTSTVIDHYTDTGITTSRTNIVRLPMNYIVMKPDGTELGDKFKSFRNLVAELMDSDIGVEVKKQYNQDLDRAFLSEEAYEEGLAAYAWDHIEEIAKSMNYRIFSVVA